MSDFGCNLQTVQRGRSKLASAALATAVLVAMPLSASGQDAVATLLPGGATSLQETHGDWTVQCVVQQASEADPVRVCALSQQQRNNQGQMVLSIQLQPNDVGASGALVLPFGLAVTQGVTLRVDELELESPVSFSTCVPLGCVVPLELDAEMSPRLSNGGVLNVTAQSAQGQNTEFSVSLRGYTAALNRTQALLE